LPCGFFFFFFFLNGVEIQLSFRKDGWCYKAKERATKYTKNDNFGTDVRGRKIIGTMIWLVEANVCLSWFSVLALVLELYTVLSLE